MLNVGDELDVKDATYTVTGRIHTGTNEIYAVIRDSGEDHILKVGPTSGDEALSIAGLLPGYDVKYRPYLPTFIGNVIVDGEFACLFERLDGFYNLAQVASYYPNGIDPKDMAWIFRRLLVPLGATHRAGYLHGALTPQHVLIHPEMHGLALIDWTHAVPVPKDGEPGVPLADYDSTWFPAEADTTHVGTHSEVFMAANLMSWLLGGDPANLVLPSGLPREIRIFLSVCLKADWERRPDDAWKVLHDFDNAIERLWGKKKFHPFHIPPK